MFVRNKIVVVFTDSKKGIPGTYAVMRLSRGAYRVGDPHEPTSEEVLAKRCETPLIGLHLPKEASLDIAQKKNSGEYTACVTDTNGHRLLEWVLPDPAEVPESELYKELLGV